MLAWWCLSPIADGTVRMSARAPHPSDVWWLTRKAHRAQQSHCLTLAPCIYTRSIPYRIPCCRLVAACGRRQHAIYQINQRYSRTLLHHNQKSEWQVPRTGATRLRGSSERTAGTTCKTHTDRIIGSICSDAPTRDTTMYILEQWPTDNLISHDKPRGGTGHAMRYGRLWRPCRSCILLFAIWAAVAITERCESQPITSATNPCKSSFQTPFLQA